MRGNVLRKLTAATLFLTALPVGITASTNGPDDEAARGRRGLVSMARTQHCAAPAGWLEGPRAEIGGRKAAAIALVLLAQHARVNPSH